MTLEIELGVTGGEEDGVDNTDVDESKLYTSQKRWPMYERLTRLVPIYNRRCLWKCTWRV